MRRVHHRLQVGVAGGQAWYSNLGGSGVALGGDRADVLSQGGLFACCLLRFGCEALEQRSKFGVAAREALELVIELAEGGEASIAW